MSKTLSQLKASLPEYTTLYLGKWPHQYKCIQLQNPANNQLLRKLEEDGFFNFQPTNKGHIVGEHQIIAFYACGGVHAHRRGVTNADANLEVHHMDGNTYNNEPCNLRYAPVWLHNQITKLQRRVHQYLKLFSKQEIQPAAAEHNLFNKHGKIIPSDKRVAWCAQLILKSVCQTYKWCVRSKIGRSLEVLIASPKQVMRWARQISKRLQLGVDLSFVSHSWLEWTT